MTLTHHKTYNHNNQTLQYRVCDQGLQTCQFDYFNICWQVKYIWAPYLSFKLSVRDKTWNWWIFPNRNLEHKYFSETPEILLFSKVVSVEEFYMLVKNDSLCGVSNLPKFWTFFSHNLLIKKWLYSNSSLSLYLLTFPVSIYSYYSI